MSRIIIITPPPPPPPPGGRIATLSVGDHLRAAADQYDAMVNGDPIPHGAYEIHRTRRVFGRDQDDGA